MENFDFVMVLRFVRDFIFNKKKCNLCRESYFSAFLYLNVRFDLTQYLRVAEREHHKHYNRPLTGNSQLAAATLQLNVKASKEANGAEITASTVGNRASLLETAKKKSIFKRE